MRIGKDYCGGQNQDQAPDSYPICLSKSPSLLHGLLLTQVHQHAHPQSACVGPPPCETLNPGSPQALTTRLSLGTHLPKSLAAFLSASLCRQGSSLSGTGK